MKNIKINVVTLIGLVVAVACLASVMTYICVTKGETKKDGSTTGGTQDESKKESKKGYIGKWYQFEDADYVKISTIEEDKIVFDWFIYRMDNYENITANFKNEDTAEFTAKNDLGDHEIKGTLTLKDNKVKVEVIEIKDPETTNLEQGYSITFDKRSEM